MLSFERLTPQKRRILNTVLNHAPTIRTQAVAKEAGVSAKQVGRFLHQMRLQGFNIKRRKRFRERGMWVLEVPKK